MLSVFLISIYILILTLFMIFFIKTVQRICLFSIVSSVLVFMCSCAMFIFIDFTHYHFHFINIKISKYFGLAWTLGVDQFSFFFILLVSFLTPLLLIYGQLSIKNEMKLFNFVIISLELILLFCFSSFDLFSFYFWFESSLIPMFLIIVTWGSNFRKIIAAYYLLIYTIFFSLPLLYTIILIHYYFETTSIIALNSFFAVPLAFQKKIWWAFFLAFAVKTPLFPFHVWLPEAHVEAPTVGSIILAGILLKIGYYGFVRILFSCVPGSTLYFKTFFVFICTLSAIYSSIIASGQTDVKRIIAYSSVSHMSFCLLGLNSGCVFGFVGSFLLSIGHTFVSSALFLLVGIIYERVHCRGLDYFSGLSYLLPTMSSIKFYFLISNFGFPCSLNFVAEILIFIGVANISFLILLSLLFYSVFNLIYNLGLYIRMYHGSVRTGPLGNHNFYLDLSKSELMLLFPLVFNSFFSFIFPSKLLNLIVPFSYFWVLK